MDELFGPGTQDIFDRLIKIRNHVGKEEKDIKKIKIKLEEIEEEIKDLLSSTEENKLPFYVGRMYIHSINKVGLEEGFNIVTDTRELLPIFDFLRPKGNQAVVYNMCGRNACLIFVDKE